MLPIVVAFLAGILTILSPCVLPVVPLVLGAGSTGRLSRLAGVLVGFGTTFVLTTVLLASVLGASGISTSAIRLAAVLLLGVFGLTLVVPQLQEAVERTVARRMPAPTGLSRPSGDGLAGGLVLGAATGLVWAPCVGPIMATAVAAAVATGPSAASLVPAIAYVVGAAIPLAVIALLGRGAVSRFGSAAARSRAMRAFGVATVATALIIAIGLDVPIQSAVDAALPTGWSQALLAIEDTGGDEPVTTPSSRPIPGSLTDASLPAPISATLPPSVALQDLGPAHGLEGITDWINSAPLTIASLRGKVVLVHFWTFACINCIHVQPYVKAWNDRYASSGLVVLGVHTPELSFERDIANVRDAVAKDDVRFPVAFDPLFKTWNAYGNRYWPAFYFIDRSGEIRYVAAGEGGYDTSEQVIRELLAGA
jgi:cytochrome c biogenesis protein CcdA/thiol-disulfide isomerase/thioredoxin